MNRDIEQAKQILDENNFTCVLVKGDSVYTSNKKGVAPVLDLMSDKTDLNGYSLADRVIGKSVAYLVVHAGIKEVNTIMISKHALEVFEKYQIPFTYNKLVDRILNNAQDGFCPMESTVLNEDNPEKAFVLLENKLKELRKGI